MVEEDRYCIDIVTQIAAVRAALRRLEEEILRDHVSHCVEHAINSGNKTDQRRKIEELMAVVSSVTSTIRATIPLRDGRSHFRDDVDAPVLFRSKASCLDAGC